MRRAAMPLLAATLLAGAADAADPARRYLPAQQAAPGAPPHYSAAVEVKDTLYVSGLTDVDPATGRPPATAEAGARRVLDAFRATLEAAGYTMNELVQVQVSARDIADLPAFDKAYTPYFDGPKPARGSVGVGALPGGARFEMMGIAVRKGK